MFCVGCNDSFLEKQSESSLTKNTFFLSTKDLETYTYDMYPAIPYNFDDNSSDNIVYNTEGSDIESMIRGEVNAENKTKGWAQSSWSSLRAINLMLDNLGSITGDQSEIDHYIGLAKFFRALFYWSKVKTFGDVPWYEHVLENTDLEELYKPRDSRTFVMDKVLEDLDWAIRHMKVKSNTSVAGKYQVEALASRIALYEGTFRKYHTELNLGDATACLQKAVEWSKDVIDNGGFSLVDIDQYASMFNDNILAGNKEVIMYKKSSRDIGVGNNTHIVCDIYWAASASLMREFLMSDGSRFTDQADHDKKSYVESFDNRDPRLSVAIMPPGSYKIDGGKPHIIRIEFGGYPQYKFYPARKDLAWGWDMNYTDLPIIRLSEIYLTYAEARAEMGELTDLDLEYSVNHLRTRAHLPALTIDMANANIDNELAKQHSNIEGINRGIIIELRRERRVELAFEGLRKDDLYRWKLATNLIKFVPQGVYFPSLGAHDVTGDGIADLAILERPEADDATNYKGLVLHYLYDKNGKANTFYLENQNSGRIEIASNKNANRKFIEPQYYFYPIPTSEVVLNGNLTQLYGW
ncbi:hypothetical protein AwDysgo_16470 [Bacteroidales bacterium]|nr:hypothetical protein AwDysgo_16470 [Bacteroidales bacterium]